MRACLAACCVSRQFACLYCVAACLHACMPACLRLTRYVLVFTNRFTVPFTRPDFPFCSIFKPFTPLTNPTCLPPSTTFLLQPSSTLFALPFTLFLALYIPSESRRSSLSPFHAVFIFSFLQANYPDFLSETRQLIDYFIRDETTMKARRWLAKLLVSIYKEWSYDRTNIAGTGIYL